MGDPGLKIDSEIFVGEPVKVGDRSIYPVLKISKIMAEGGEILAAWTSPKALAIAESGKAYAASLTDEETSIEELVDLVPSLRDMLSDELSR